MTFHLPLCRAEVEREDDTGKVRALLCGNRAMLLNRQHGLNLPETCGETITLTQLWRNAREIYP